VPPSKTDRTRSADQQAAGDPKLRCAGQALAKSGKPRSTAEFTARHRVTLEPYNVQALYGRGLIYQADKHHEQESRISPVPPPLA